MAKAAILDGAEEMNENLILMCATNPTVVAYGAVDLKMLWIHPLARYLSTSRYHPDQRGQPPANLPAISFARFCVSLAGNASVRHLPDMELLLD